MRILITGSNGQLGRELIRQLMVYPKMFEVFNTDHNTLDITNNEHVQQVVGSLKPHVVINCAAYTNVDSAETDKEKVYRINVIGAENLARMCECLDIKFVHMSTDYVFEGLEMSPRREEDSVNPQSIYGISKLQSEKIVRNLCTKHFIIRTAWLYGEGNNFVRTMLRLARTEKEINVVGDQIGSPTYTKDLVNVMINLIQTDYYGTYHATCEGACSWYDFACEIFSIMGMNIKVNKVTSEELERPAKRPKYSVLENYNLNCHGLNTFRNWHEALIDYLEEERM